jgi:GT2 family glycosyltransferase
MVNLIMNKVLSIVIPVWNKWNFTMSCLRDLSQLPDDHEIIIVDNASTDETQQEIIELDRSLQMKNKLIIHRNKENLGFAKACNIGYGLATAPNVLFLNNDIRVKSNYTDWTKELIKWCPTHIVGPTMGQLDSALNFVKEANELLPGKSYMSGWCIASSKDVWEKLIIKDYQGPFSEEFGIAYFEDTDLGFRARQQGTLLQIVDIPVVHFGKQTSAQLNTYKLYTQAREIFVKKWLKK